MEIDEKRVITEEAVEVTVAAVTVMVAIRMVILVTVVKITEAPVAEIEGIRETRQERVTETIEISLAMEEMAVGVLAVPTVHRRATVVLLTVVGLVVDPTEVGVGAPATPHKDAVQAPVAWTEVAAAGMVDVEAPAQVLVQAVATTVQVAEEVGSEAGAPTNTWVRATPSPR